MSKKCSTNAATCPLSTKDGRNHDVDRMSLLHDGDYIFLYRSDHALGRVDLQVAGREAQVRMDEEQRCSGENGCRYFHEFLHFVRVY